MPTVEERVKRVIMDQLDVEESELTPEASFADDLGADSLDHVELAMGLEEEFDVEVNDADAEATLTVGDAVALVERKLAAGGK